MSAVNGAEAGAADFDDAGTVVRLQPRFAVVVSFRMQHLKADIVPLP